MKIEITIFYMIMSWNMREQKNNGGNNCEKKLIKSTAGFFKEPETAGFRTRIERWAEGMENAYEAYPEALGDLLMDLGAWIKLLRLTKIPIKFGRDG